MRPLYCDESIWIPVADGLRQRGWKVRTAREEDMLGNPDQQQLEYAVDNDWILVTFDDDFVSRSERNDLEHAGVTKVGQAGRDIGDVVKTLDAHLEAISPDDRGIQFC